MDVRLIRGRAFTEADGASGTPVAIVNQRFAEKFFRGDEPIGRRLRIFEDDMPRLGVVGSKKTGAWMTVVGVAPNILQNDIDAHRFDPLIYVPYRQKPMRDMAFDGPHARASVHADQRVPARNAGRRPGHAAVQHTDSSRAPGDYYWQQGVFGTLFGIFAAIALVLASVGLYAVIAHSVSQRTQENRRAHGTGRVGSGYFYRWSSRKVCGNC